ncbi:MAG: phosphatidate cytidylyltransferase [Planctomycetes bacterium]|nr:phosphatidate cytidylyltransferase [Planctomycetota bacterium]
MVSRDVRTRAVLAPTMLAIIGLVYWADLQGWFARQGSVSAALLGLLGMLGVHEYITLLRGGGFAVARRLLLALSAALFLSAYWFGWHELDRELYPLVTATLLLVFPLAVRSLGQDDMRVGLEKQGATLLGFIFVAWPLYLAQGCCFRHLPSVLYVVLVCKGGDIGGYCVGKLIGRHKLIPHISPGKTWEGMFGSLLTAVAIAIALRGPLLLPAVPMGLGTAVLVGVVLNFTTQTGDLIESLLKRRCGAKDSSSLLPAHGGVLDLIDSLLFSFCAWFLFLIWLTGPGR